MSTFNKFDALGSALSELSFERVHFEMIRRDGEITYTVYLFECLEDCSHGNGSTPSDALQSALSRHASKLAARVERAAA